MPSGAKRRKAAKKKKAAAISNECNGGDNNLKTQQIPITKDVDDEKNILLSESVENLRQEMLNGEMVGIVGKAAESKNSSLSAVKDGSQLVDNGQSKVATNLVSSAFPNEANHVKNDIHAFTGTVIHQKSIVELMKLEETFSDLEVGTFQTNGTNCGEASREFVAKIRTQSATPVANGVWNTEGSDIQHSAEKEPLLLPRSRQVNKTSWTGCCGLLELLTGSSR